MTTKHKPHIVMVIGRGEAIRNFLYSDTIKILSEHAKVTLLTVAHDEKFISQFASYVDQIIPLRKHTERKLVSYIRHLALHAHYRWLWTEKAKNKWEILDAQASHSSLLKAKHVVWKAVIYVLANRPMVRILTALDRAASWYLRPTDEFEKTFRDLQPDLVFNTSHIHGEAADLPMRVAHRMGIPTAAFIFSWDNLTTRSRLLVPYDYYLVWHQKMRSELLSIYPEIDPERVFITGTPQFDFHFRPEFWLSKEELLTKLGADPARPYILYTTGMASDFPEEHHHIRLVIRLLQEIDIGERPQLIVRTYIKGTGLGTKAIADENIPGVIFPPILWDKEWYTPAFEDLSIYTSLLRHTVLGINAASTVSLELMMFDKPVINLGYDPPGSNLPHHLRWVRHIEFEHYTPVANSGAVMVARFPQDMAEMFERGLSQPERGSEQQRQFIQDMFGDTLDGLSGKRVAEKLVELSMQRTVK